MSRQPGPVPCEATMEALTAYLETALQGPLPGVPGQLRMAPRPRPGWDPDHPARKARDAAGLLLLFPGDGRPHLLLTLRSLHLPSHRGQVSLPGGVVEEGETPVETALREAHEETGIDPASVRILGELTPLHIPVSGFLLHPVVGVAERRPGFVPEPGEVERILEIPIARLCDPGVLGTDERRLLQGTRRCPYFRLDGEKVWGATAMVLSEFLTLLGHPPDPPSR